MHPMITAAVLAAHHGHAAAATLTPAGYVKSGAVLAGIVIALILLSGLLRPARSR